MKHVSGLNNGGCDEFCPGYHPAIFLEHLQHYSLVQELQNLTCCRCRRVQIWNHPQIELSVLSRAEAPLPILPLIHGNTHVDK